jgi:hypothetical protein
MHVWDKFNTFCPGIIELTLVCAFGFYGGPYRTCVFFCNRDFFLIQCVFFFCNRDFFLIQCVFKNLFVIFFMHCVFKKFIDDFF